MDAPPAKEVDASRAADPRPPSVQSNDDARRQPTTNAPTTATTTANSSSVAQISVDKVLRFLSNASNETLGACLAGLGAATYLVLGRVGLVVIGLAGGVVLQATWEGIRRDTRDDATKRLEQERRREVGVEVIKRVLDWRDSTRTNLRAEDVKVFPSQALDFSEFGQETEQALNAFADAVIKDYVHYWYDPTIPGEETFPAACRRTLTAFLLSLGAHLNRKRAADAFLDFLTNSSSIIIVFLTELSAALNASPNSSAEDAIATYLELKPDSSLSYMLDPDSQATKLGEAAEEILQAYLDPKAYNCPPVHAFLKQVLSQLVLGSTVTLCSRPEWINDWIVYGLEESETTKDVMGMVDAGVEGKVLPVVATGSPAESGQIGAPDEKAQLDSDASPGHRRARSRAEISMEEAMEEARRLTALIIAEDERRAKEQGAEVEARPEALPKVVNAAAPPSDSNDDKEGGNDTQPQSLAQSAESEMPQRSNSADSTNIVTAPVSISEPTEQTSLSEEKARRESVVLTLHNATISIFDDSMPGERASIKAKPTTDYLIQIEPSASELSGWMIARKFADFETLHEVLRRIAVITGVTFKHTDLPQWRNNTKANLRTELERYLCDAVRLQPLAESEGMKRFLDKDRGLMKSPGAGKAFGWPAPDALGKIGGDMMSVLTKAPKQVAGGGKAVLGGVAGLVTSGKKTNASASSLARSAANGSVDKLQNGESRDRTSIGGSSLTDSYPGSAPARASQDSLRAHSLQDRDRRGSSTTTTSEDSRVVAHETPKRPRSFVAQTPDTPVSLASPTSSTAHLPDAEAPLEIKMNLPPPPSEMPEDYASPTSTSKRSHELGHQSRESGANSLDAVAGPATPSKPPRSERATASKPKAVLTEREAAVAIELMFAVITQLYTLSSAWNIRRTLLTAAKTFLLRPGNPQLLGIRDLLQHSLLDANLSDAGIAYQVYKLRENALPTDEEMVIWNRDYPPKDHSQKEELRVKARKLLVSRGMPQALTSVMGAAASGEALGKVFDSLQVEKVSRGLVFGLILQALRVITH